MTSLMPGGAPTSNPSISVPSWRDVDAVNVLAETNQVVASSGRPVAFERLEAHGRAVGRPGELRRVAHLKGKPWRSAASTWCGGEG